MLPVRQLVIDTSRRQFSRRSSGWVGNSAFYRRDVMPTHIDCSRLKFGASHFTIAKNKNNNIKPNNDDHGYSTRLRDIELTNFNFFFLDRLQMTVKWWSVLVALACCSIHRTVMCTSIQLDLRPVPSNDPGVVDLIESVNPALDPRPADLNVTALLAKLAAKFDPKCMSVTAPEQLVPAPDIPFR